MRGSKFGARFFDKPVTYLAKTSARQIFSVILLSSDQHSESFDLVFNIYISQTFLRISCYWRIEVIYPKDVYPAITYIFFSIDFIMNKIQESTSKMFSTFCSRTFWLFFLILLLPSIIPIHLPPVREFCFDCTISFILAYGVNAILNQSLRRTSTIILLSILSVLSVINVFLIMNFDTYLSSYIFLLIDETNPSESKEFINQYLFSWTSILILLLVFAIISASLLFSKVSSFFYRHWPHIFKTLLGVIMIVSFARSAPLFRYFGSDYINNYRNSFLTSNPLFTLTNSIWQYASLKSENDLLFDTIQTYDECVQSSINGTNIKIVLVLGESFNKHHSSLYGYKKDTNPLLANRDITVFNDVVSCSNSSSQVLKNILSTASFDDGVKWCLRPLFPQIFRNAGYKVTYWSNQFLKNHAHNVWANEGAFLNLPEVEESCFDSRNDKGCPYDADLVTSFFELQGLEENQNELILFHLMGSHIERYDRFPKNYAVFSAEDYIDTPNLKLNQRQDVADYDNSVLYNDYVIDSIIRAFENENSIIIYLSDHADETHEFRNHIGRSFDFDSTEWGGLVLKNQVEIPFIIYTSHLFDQTNPDVSLAVKSSADRPFVTDNLSNLLFDIASINTKYFRPDRSLINRLYKRMNHRLIENPQSFELFDYDNIVRGD